MEHSFTASMTAHSISILSELNVCLWPVCLREDALSSNCYTTTADYIVQVYHLFSNIITSYCQQLPTAEGINMSKAIFTAEQLETLLSCVRYLLQPTAIDKFDACLDKMMDKFESHLAKVYDELLVANHSIDKLEQTLKQQD